MTDIIKGKVLIIGISSQIGTGLKAAYSNNGFNVIGTSRKKIEADTIFMDLEDPNFEVIEDQYDAAIICAGTTKISECQGNPILHRKINVTNTIRLIEHLICKNTFITFISSSAVFDGKRPDYSVDDVTCPVTYYGEFKAEVENFLKNKYPKNSCVLRITKVFGSNNIVEEWKTKISKGIKIKIYKNVFISPLLLEKVVDTIFFLTNKKFNGVYQLSGDQLVSYEQLAQQFINFRSLPKDLIEIDNFNDSNQIIYHSLLTNLPNKL